MAKQDPLNTPMMKQYFTFKKQAKDAILFFRLGDFYEMFFDDAVKASEILGITLTSRHKDADIPLAGIPWHSADQYIKKLLDAGQKVAVCEQVEKADPKKKMVKRELVRILTPGTVVEESSLSEAESNWLMAISVSSAHAVLVWVDVSCGDMFFIETTAAGVEDYIRRVSPREVIGYKSPYASFVALDSDEFDLWMPSVDSAAYLERYAGSITKNSAVEKAFHLILFYLDSLYFGKIPPLRPPRLYADAEIASIDSNTIANLEIYRTVIGANYEGSLLWAVDRTVTPMGKRLIKNIIKQPLSNPDRINDRLNAVSFLLDNPTLLSELKILLKNIRDIERNLSRIKVKRGGPREVVALSHSIVEAFSLLSLVEQKAKDAFPSVLRPEQLPDISVFRRWKELFVALPPTLFRDGGFINPEAHPDVAHFDHLINNSRDVLVAMEERERAATGINNLKVGFNRVFGYYIEIPKRFNDKVPEHYTRKQTTANNERYFTEELKEIEEEILTAREKLIAIEMQILSDVVDEISQYEEALSQLSQSVAWCDLFVSFAALAQDENLVRPMVSYDESISIVDGRHPVAEKMLPHGGYVPATVHIGEKGSRLNIVTGPNMGGKSTMMRMVAIVTLMAQCGSFVPAKSAKITVVDAIFTRVGASDNLAKGESTFLVEMKESATILAQATESSLIILDEIGRGTGTYDGISLAWAIAENIVKKVGAIALFATHYHVLTELEDEFPVVKNFHMGVREFGGKIQFTYQLKEGGSSRSFGIEVAKLAHMPPSVIKKAEKMLKQFEESDRKMRAQYTESLQTDIFSIAEQHASSSQQKECEHQDIIEQLQFADLDEMTPREAQKFLYDIVDTLKKE
ncbi:DNA mismatch repair protein MutS [bacterium]|nr:DNA mismatch repair protein MutS [bacterium]